MRTLFLLLLALWLPGCYALTLPGVQREVIHVGADQLDRAFGLGKYKSAPAQQFPEQSSPVVPMTPPSSPYSQTSSPQPQQHQVAQKAPNVCQDSIQRVFYTGCWK